MDSLLDQVERVTGKLDLRTITAISRGSASAIVGLVGELRQIDGATTRVSAKSDAGQYRPYLEDALCGPGRDRWDRSRKALLPGSGDADLLTYVRTQLLYCHAVVVDDPLTALVSPGMFGTWASVDADAIRVPLEEALRFLREVAPLCDAGLLTLLPPDSAWYRDWWYRCRSSGGKRPPEYFMTMTGHPGHDHTLGSVESLNMPVDTSTRGLLTDAVKEVIRRTGSEPKRWPLLQAAEGAAGRVARYIRFGGGVDFEVPDELGGIALHEVLAQEARGGVDGPPADHGVDSGGLRRLVSVPLLTSAGPAHSDILRSRAEPNAFTEWRAALRRGLEQISAAVESGGSAPDDAARRTFREALAPAAATLAEETRGTAGPAGVGAQELIVGVIPVGAGVLGGPAVGSAAAAAGTVRAAWTYSTGTGARRTATTSS